MDVNSRIISLIFVKLFDYICLFFNDPISSSKFPSSLVCANITSFLKQKRELEENHRPVSSFLVISKIFEKIMSKQFSTFFEGILSKFQCGFQTLFSTQHSLLLMLVTWKKAADNHQVFGLASYSQLCLKCLTASIRLNSKSTVNFKNLWRSNLGNKQLQHTSWPIFQEVKAIREWNLSS